MNDLDPESSRYASAAGWEPKDKWAKLREKLRRDENAPGSRAFELESGAVLSRAGAVSPPAALFGDLWREGEAALLVGESGAAKSILAVQLAEAIARGPRVAGKGRRRVIYLDLERTLDQFLLRYSAPLVGGERHFYRFSSRFRRARIDNNIDVPERYRRDIYRFFRDQVCGIIDSGKADAVIIDSAEHLVPSLARSQAGMRLMKYLKFSARKGTAVLLVSHTKRRRSGRLLTVDDIAGGAEIANVADSVFALGRSTMGEDLRYLKHLRSAGSPIRLDENRVAVYRIERGTQPQTPRGALPDPAAEPYREAPGHAARSPAPTPDVTCLPPETGAAAVVRAVLSHMRPFDGTPTAVRPAAGPAHFLGLTHVGYSTESAHCLDYAALDQKLVREPKLINTRPRSLTTAILDGSYARYLNGD